MSTQIQWTDETWNPTTGCTRVSEGCRHCYIERTPAFRMAGRKFVNGTTGVLLHPDRLDAPLHWKKPRRVFVNSLSDLFHEDIPNEFIEQVFGIMGSCQRHTFQVLTKRPASMMEFMKEAPLWWQDTPPIVYHETGYPPKNVWLGVSCEDQATYKSRVLSLALTPAAVRFISFEPLLEDIGDLMLDGVFGGAYQWAIIGGESGPHARPCDLAWIRSIKDQCQAARVPVFVKQLGRVPFVIHKTGNKNWIGLQDKKGGDISEFPMELRVREYPG